MLFFLDDILSASSQRQFDNESSAFSEPAVNRNGATMFLNNSIAEAQAQASAFSDFLGGKERVENLREIFFVNAGAIVLKADPDQITAGFGGDSDGSPGLMPL